MTTKRLCRTALLLSLCAILGGCQGIKQKVQQQAAIKQVDMLRGIVKQEILAFFNWLQANRLLLGRPSFTDWAPRILGEVDPETGLLIPRVEPPPLYESPDDIPADILKELADDTKWTEVVCRDGHFSP